MKNDIQDRSKAETLSKFPMANRVAQTEKFLHDHEGKPSEQTSRLSEILKQRLGEKNEQALEKMFARVNEAVQSGVDYITENPNDSKLVAATAELAAWVKKQAEPGVKAIESAADTVLPKVEAWIVDVLDTDKNADKNAGQSSAKKNGQKDA